MKTQFLLEVTEFEESREFASVQNEDGQAVSLEPKPTRYFLKCKFPDGTVKSMETDKDAVDKYAASLQKMRGQCPYSGT